MPGATCGHLGVCGAVSSIGAALSIIDGTGPLSTDGTWGKHMKFTSKALGTLAEINGPRCCKRDSYLSILSAIDFVKENFGIEMEKPDIICSHSAQNNQCIGKRCPFSKANH